MKLKSFATGWRLWTHGQIIAEGSPADLIEKLGGHHVVEFSVSGSSDGGGDRGVARVCPAWSRSARMMGW